MLDIIVFEIESTCLQYHRYQSLPEIMEQDIRSTLTCFNVSLSKRKWVTSTNFPNAYIYQFPADFDTNKTN